MKEDSVFDSFRFPVSWKSEKLRRVFDNRKTLTDIELPLLGANIALGVTERFEGDGRPAASEDLSKYKVVDPGDIIMNPLGKPHGSIGRSNVRGITSPAYWVLRCNEPYESRYAHYLLRSEVMINEFKRRSKNLPPNQFDLPWEQFRDFEFHFPPLEEQRRIADYLDAQVLLIDQLVELKERANEAYAEAFASLKHARVTGADQENLVVTGLSWLPKAPGAWRKVSLQSQVTWRKGIDSGRLNAEYCGRHEGIYPVYSGQTANDGVFAQIDTYDFDFAQECLLMSTVGAQAGRTKLIGGKFSLSQNCAILMAQTSDVSLRYLNFLWPSIWSVMSSEIPSDMQPSVRFSDLAKQWLVLPSLDEQIGIVKVISKAQENSDSLVSSARSQIDKLRELKNSLISAALTGTFDVSTGRNVA